MKVFYPRCSRFGRPSSAFQHHFNTQLHHKHLSPPKANQTLKAYLTSNSTTQLLLHFRELLRKNPSAIDSFSFLYVLKSCINKSDFLQGLEFHALVLKFGFQSVIHLQTLLLHLYSLTGNLFDAHKLFDEIPTKNIVCWTTLISAYVENQSPKKALELFKQMQMQDVEPDKVTLTVALSACADLGALRVGQWIHDFVTREEGFSSDLSLNNALVNMFAKCGDMKNARRVFDATKKKDVTTWTSLIVGHAVHGEAEEALRLFEEMKAINKNPANNSPLVVPNHITFIGVLTACSYAGMVQEGKHYFMSMIKDYGLKPRISHFGCLVDLFCRAGLLKEAYGLISAMRERPNSVVLLWRMLLGACSRHGNVKLGVEVRGKLMELEPNHVSDHIAVSNIFAANCMWDEKIVSREQIKSRKTPGCSSIEVVSGNGNFLAANQYVRMKLQVPSKGNFKR